jgi:hypothetical protein
MSRPVFPESKVIPSRVEEIVEQVQAKCEISKAVPINTP